MKTKTIFDKQKYQRISEENWRGEFNLKQALKLLNEEGMPTDLDFLKSITKDEDAFRQWIVEQQRQRLSGGFVTSAERDVIIQGFRDLFEKLNPAIQSLRSSMNTSLVLVADGDSVKNDAEAVEKKQREQATITIDADKADEYYKIFKRVIDAHKDLCQHEEDKGYFPQSTFLRFHEFTPFGWEYEHNADVSEERFTEIHKYKFIKK